MKRLMAAAAFAVALAATSASAEPFKVGFVYVGPIGDFGYSYQHEQARLALEKHYGEAVKTAFVENVSNPADVERVLTQFAQQGYDMVFSTSFSFMTPTLKVAKRFPNVKFEHATGYKRAPNVSTYSGRFYEARSVMGHIAGKTTKTNVVGYVAAVPVPEVVNGINAFTLAMRKVNPKAVVKVVWVNSWYDPGKERQAAETLAAQGADIIVQHTDSAAPVQFAEEKGLLAFGQWSDMHAFGPHAQLSSLVLDWAPYYIERVALARDGKWSSTDVWGGLKSGMVRLAPFNPIIPEDVRRSAQQMIEDIGTGVLHPFAGPIKDRDGTLRAAAGEVIGDDDVLAMNWFVEGVQGTLPK